MARSKTPEPSPPPPAEAPAAPPPLQYTPCTLRLDQIDSQTMRHTYCHRDGDSMKWSDDAAPSNLKSLGESLLAEGQLVPVEFYRSGDSNILVRGYRLIEAIQQIIARALDPERFHSAMEIKAVEIRGGAEADYLVRAIASNEVRCNLSPEAQYTVAAMMLDRGIAATRGARALGVSATQFARFVRRYNNPWMQEHVRSKHIEQSYADELLEAASAKNQVARLQSQMDALVQTIQSHIDTLRARAVATKSKWDEEKEGVVTAYIKKRTVTPWKKALEEGEEYTPTPDIKPPDWTFTCEIDAKDGKLRIVGLNGLALSQKSYSDLGVIAGRLHMVATQVKAIWLAAKAKAESTNGDADQALIDYYRECGATDLADALATKLKTHNGESDPSHGNTPIRKEAPLAATIGVPEQPARLSKADPNYDPAQDDGPEE